MLSYAQPAVIYVLRLVHIAIASHQGRKPLFTAQPDCVDLLTISLMFNKLFNNQVVSHGYSDCADYIIANVKDGTAIVSFKSSGGYKYTNVSRRALIKLIMQRNISLGRWINDNLLFSGSKAFKFGSVSTYAV